MDEAGEPKPGPAPLPGLDCGLCGVKTCAEFAGLLVDDPRALERCIHLGKGSRPAPAAQSKAWQDALGREYDFVLDAFTGDPGPRETIIPRNPARTKELGIVKGDLLIGRPMGMSCGCPVTHCGVVQEADPVNGVIVWCVTGPLGPRSGAHKDVGFYSAEAYEGTVKSARTELEIGRRYWFLPHRCMLQWRHSGLVNFINRRQGVLQVRVEGLMIG